MKKSLVKETSSDLVTKSYASSLKDVLCLGKILNNFKDKNGKRLTTTEQLRFRAMFFLSFFCWFRTEEVMNLRLGQIKLQSGRSSSGIEYQYYLLKMGVRKSNQLGKKIERYEIHDDPDVSEKVGNQVLILNTFTVMKEWLEEYKKKVCKAGEALQDEFFLFPLTIANQNCNGTLVYPDKISASYYDILKELYRFTDNDNPVPILNE